MKNSKQHLKLNKLQVKAEQCLSRKEAKKIIIKANKAQEKINNQNQNIYFNKLKVIKNLS